MSDYLKNSFNGGVFGRLLRARADLAKYANSCMTLENFFVTPYGGIENRSGFLFEKACNDESHPVRLFPFQFSNTESYLLEFGYCYVVIHDTGFSTRVVKTTPYTDLTKLRTAQIGDYFFIVHPDYPPHVLMHTTDGWKFEEFALKNAPFCDENTTDITMTPGSVTGSGITITASGDYFEDDMVGALLKIYHPNSNCSLNKTFTANGESTSMKVKGAWTFVTYGSWVGKVVLYRSKDNGSTWDEYRHYSSNANNNADDSGYESEPCQFKFALSGWQSAPSGVLYECRATLNLDEGRLEGIAKITSVNSATSVTADIQEDFTGTAASSEWALGAWNDHCGYPAQVAFYSDTDRLVFASTRLYPQTFYFSAVSDYNNFYADVYADNAVVMTIRTGLYNEIRWMRNRKALVVGMANGIGRIVPNKDSEAFGPDNHKYVHELETGCAAIDPVLVNEVMLFLRRGGRDLMELSYDYYNDGYIAPDMTLLAPEVLNSTAKELCFRAQPYPVAFFVLGDGSLASFTYNRKEEVAAWAIHKSGSGSFESAAVLMTDDEADDLYCVIQNGTNRWIEKLSLRKDESNSAGCYLDHAVAVDSETAVSSISVTHLAGSTVTAVIDGAVNPGLAVSDEGVLTLPYSGKSIRAGVPYTSIMQTMPLDIVQTPRSTLGERKRINVLLLKLERSLGGEVRFAECPYMKILQRTTEDKTGSAAAIRSSSFELTIPATYADEATVTVKQESPYPFTLLGIVANYMEGLQ